jgi:hypothetical protein
VIIKSIRLKIGWQKQSIQIIKDALKLYTDTYLNEDNASSRSEIKAMRKAHAMIEHIVDEFTLPEKYKCIWYKADTGTCKMDNSMCVQCGCDGFEVETKG